MDPRVGSAGARLWAALQRVWCRLGGWLAAALTAPARSARSSNLSRVMRRGPARGSRRTSTVPPFTRR